MSLSLSQKKTLRDMQSMVEFRRQVRIQHKMVSKYRLDHIGKGYYYYIEHSRPDERIMDVITDQIKLSNGGYVRTLHHWKKGNKCNTELLDSYEKFNKLAAKVEVGTEILRGNLGISLSENYKQQKLLNHKGETNCDILVVQVGGTTNGCCCRKPSKVEGNIIIRTITDKRLNNLNLEEQNKNQRCLIM